jgi:hypothetical protein
MKKDRSSAKTYGVSSEKLDAARVIAKIKGEDIDAIIAQVITEYVDKNIHLLTEKAKATLVLEQ